ncbi:hypothetical protein PAEPH01_1303, partial [Pancytospora epiphaga]
NNRGKFLTFLSGLYVRHAVKYKNKMDLLKVIKLVLCWTSLIYVHVLLLFALDWLILGLVEALSAASIFKGYAIQRPLEHNCLNRKLCYSDVFKVPPVVLCYHPSHVIM